ncbi:MAG: Gfo/Idh/MocA family oxidoreductase [Planctomycetes bacterium]|nr:Gfo/Idh/MocA family oxidoreductase [Planctomycetota bacterium]
MSQLSRRQFLENSMFATAAAALVGGQTRPLYAADAGPDEKLRVVCIGVNGRGGSHIAEFGARKDCEIAAIVDVDEVVGNRKADDIEKRFGKRPTVYLDMRKCFEDKSLHIASIATPNHWHALSAIWAIQAGLDVYVEKPVSHNVTEGRRIVEAARKYKRIVQTGTQSRSNPGMREAIAFLHNGGIGEVKLARGLCYKPRGSIGPRGNYDVPASVNYDLWSGPAQMHPLTRPRFHYDWHWQWDYGNGDLGNQGIHQMDIARWGLNEMNLGESIRSYGGRFAYVDAGETANTQVSIHEFQNGKRLVFEVRGLKTEPLMEASVGVIFYGSDGYLVMPSYNGGMVFDKDGKKTEKVFKGGGDSHHFANFVGAVRSRNHEDLNADILQGHLSSALCHVGNISYRLGAPVTAEEISTALTDDKEALETLDRFQQHLLDNKVSPDSTKITLGPKLTLAGTEEFSGTHSAEANKFLTREYRAPFVVPRTEDL